MDVASGKCTKFETSEHRHACRTEISFCAKLCGASIRLHMKMCYLQFNLFFAFGLQDTLTFACITETPPVLTVFTYTSRRNCQPQLITVMFESCNPTHALRGSEDRCIVCHRSLNLHAHAASHVHYTVWNIVEVNSSCMLPHIDDNSTN